MYSKSLMRLFRLLTIVSPLLVIMGCGDGSGPQRILATPIPPTTGIFVDAAVSGAGWQTSGDESGFTDDEGTFSYVPGETVTFSVGGIVLGSAPGAPIISAVELTGSNNPTDQAAINLMVFLQSIDADGDPSNGITISGNTTSAAAGQALDFTDPNFSTAVAAVVAAIAPGNTVVSETAALAHFYMTYSALGGTDAFSYSFPGFAPVGGGVTYDLVFADEFNEGDAPDSETWNIETGYGNGGWGNNEWQLYTDSSDNLRVEDGNLVIQARCDTPPCGVRDGTITSGRITTKDNFEFRYGTVIARIKPPVGDGAWPAFWALGANFPEVSWPRVGEIDFMEMHNAFSNDRTTHFTIHWCDETVNPSIGATGLCFPQENGWTFFTQNRSFPESLGDDYHIFEADWNENRIIGRIDGIPYFEKTIDPGTMEEFLREFFMILNVAMGGTLGSDNQPPNGNEVWPQTMLVDYVRVFQRTGQGQPAEDTLIDFENAPESYDFGASGGFGGGAAAVIDNPVSEGINTSAQVGRMLKFAGEVFAGSLLTLDAPVPISADSTITMKVWSPRQVNVLFKIEGPAEAEIEVTHGGMGWEELSFNFGPFVGSIEGISLIFDLGIVGDADNDPDNWTFYFDDILIPAADTGGGPDDPFGLVADFEGPPGVYNFGTELGFGGGVSEVLANPVSDSLNDSAQVVRMRKFGGEVFAGSLFTLPTPLTIPAGTSFTMKVWSQRPVMVLFKLEPNLAEVNLPHSGNGWEEMTFEFPAFSGTFEGITFIFDLGILGDADNDPVNWTFYFDDIFAVAPDDGGPGPDPEAPVDFEGAPASFIFSDFEGGVGDVIDNPVADTNNDSAQVGRVQKFMGADFAGSTLQVPAPLDVAAGDSFTMLVWSQRPVMVLLKLEGVGDNDAEVNVAHGGTGWEELTFPFPDYNGTVEGYTLIFDIGVVGDAMNNPMDWTFYFDDITKVPAGDGPGPGPMLSQIDLPVTFDDPTVDYTVTDFGDPPAMTTLVPDPDDSGNMVASTTKPVGAPEWAGTTISTASGLASPIPFTATATTIGVRVYSPAAGIPIRLKAEDMIGGSVSVETDVLTTVANQWETLIFNFADQVADTDPLDLDTSYTALSIFFDKGTDGDGATYLWDDVEFGVLEQIALPITFDDPLVDYTVTDFGDPAVMTTLVVDPDDAGNTVASTTKPVGAPDWAGTTMSTTAGLTAPVPFGTGLNSVGVRVYSPAAGIPVRLKAEDMVGGSVSVETDVLTTAANQWETLVFNFDEQVAETPALDLGTSYTVLSIFFDIGTDGDDSTYLWDDVEFGVPLPDTTAPMLTDVSIVSDNVPSSGTRATTGDEVTLTFTADEPIEAPTVTIAGVSVTATGSGTDWAASRVAEAGDDQGAIAFTIDFVDEAGNAGTTVSATTDGSSVIFDNVPATLSVDGAPTLITSLDPFTVTFTFSEDVTGFELADIAVTNGSAAAFASTDAATYTADIAPDGNGDVTIDVAAGAADDAAGNGSDAATAGVAIDMVSPGLATVSIVSDNATSGGTFAATGDEITVTLTADEPIIAPVVTIAGESATVTGAGTDWSASRVLPEIGQGAVGFEITFFDLVGNPGAAVSATTDGTSVTFDSVSPTVAIQDAPAEFTTLDPIPLTVGFSEAVVGFAVGDIAVTGGTASDLMGDGATYTVNVTPNGLSDVVVDIAAGAATDAAGNQSAAAATVTIAENITAPVLSFVGITTDGVTDGLQGYARAGDSVTLTITAPEDIDPPTVTIAGMSVTPTGAGTDWSATRLMEAGDDQGVVTFRIEFVTTGGIDGLPSTAVTDGSSVIFDSVAPTLSIDDTPSMVTSLDPFGVTFQFSEDVTGFELTDIVVTNGSAAGLASTDAATYTADITADGNGDVTIDVAADAAIDVAANGSAAASVTVPIDMAAPELTVVSIASDNVPSGGTLATTGDEVTLTFTADEPITAPTVTIAGASVTATGSGTDWQASRIAEAGDDQGAIAFTIDFADLVGNPGTQVTATTDSSSVVFDNVAATLTIDAPGTIASVETATFQFGEDVTGFEVADIVVTNGSADAFAITDAATYTADITPDGNGDVTIDVAADAANDIAGNGSDAASVTLTYTLPYWTEVWADDFDDAMVFGNNWTVRTDADCPDPCTGVQSYSADRVILADGVLTIRASDDGTRGAAITSGLIDTRGNLEFQHGRVEIDVQMPAGTPGVTPFLWMLPATPGEYGPWPLSGEIDLTNLPDGGDGSTLEHALRYGLPEPEDTTATKLSAKPATASTAFSTYAFEWEAGEMRWFVDGEHVAIQVPENWYAYSEDADDVYTLGTGSAPFDRDFYLVIGLAVIEATGGDYPQSLQVEAVRVYECANAVDPAAGTGCAGLIDDVDAGIVPIVETLPPYNGEPYTETLDAYTGAPISLDFVDEFGAMINGTLAPDTFGTATVTSTIDATDGANVVWNVDIDATSGSGGVSMGSGPLAMDPFEYTGSFDVRGGEPAGELLFRMRVNSATGVNPQLTVGLDSAAGSGGLDVPFVADGQWRQYSIKLGDLVTGAALRGSGLDLTNLVNVFSLEAVDGTVNLDLDDISVKVACRDIGRCEVTPRATKFFYMQDFETLVMSDPNALATDGWFIFGAYFDSMGNFLGQYGVFQAPNGGPGFSAIVAGQGGPDQGTQQLSIYNDYNCCQPSNGHFNGTDLVESTVLQEKTIDADDVGSTWTFTMDAKRNPNAGIAGDTTAMAFLKTLDPGAGFATTNLCAADTTMVPDSWVGYQVALSIDAELVGQRVQFGFVTTTSNFQDSSILYDNLKVQVTPTDVPPPGPSDCVE